MLEIGCDTASPSVERVGSVGINAEYGPASSVNEMLYHCAPSKSSIAIQFISAIELPQPPPALNSDKQRWRSNRLLPDLRKGSPEHTYEILQDYTILIGTGAVRIRLTRGEQYRGRILVDHAEIDINGVSYRVPSGILSSPKD